ncbi:MAG: ribonuclease Y [Candidatus Schekmanbacteria bacterium]|nr:ribonuclease Y [Candidatus Schekmanbacteria bacterium]
METIASDFAYILLLIVISAACLYIGFLIRKHLAESKLHNADEMAAKIISEAEKEAENKKRAAILEAKDTLYQSKADFEKETRERRQELQKMEKRLMAKEEGLDRRLSLMEKKESDLSGKEKTLQTREAGIQEQEEKSRKLVAEQQQLLEKISGMTSEEAKNQLIAQMESKARYEAGKMIKRIEEEAKESAEKKAKDIIGLSIQRCAAEHVVETTVSVVDLPNNEMKGRIIGREGRNIRALEMATGIDLIIDDTPEAVILSGYDPIRREIAKSAIEKLIQDGRIHPARIEEIVAKAKKEMDNSLREAGEQATFDLGIHGINPDEIKLLGRLKYRTSYAQNVLQHSKEVAILAGIMAAELGVDVQTAKRAGLLHDLGKAVDHNIEGNHAQIGADLAKKYNENPIIINAIAAHHEDVEAKSVFAVLIQAADAISAARPGARRESLESYVKRLEQLEQIAESFHGVEKTYAIQAGREVRILVEQNKVSDEEAMQLARDIAQKVEEDMKYPGQIKITVIRETRCVEYAK